MNDCPGLSFGLNNPSKNCVAQCASELVAGFVNVTVTGKSGDGGIDGAGTYRLSLVSFPVYFQCKRYKGSVGSPEVRNFRGAMQGRTTRGVILTTGVFTFEDRGSTEIKSIGQTRTFFLTGEARPAPQADLVPGECSEGRLARA